MRPSAVSVSARAVSVAPTTTTRPDETPADRTDASSGDSAATPASGPMPARNTLTSSADVDPSWVSRCQTLAVKRAFLDRHPELVRNLGRKRVREVLLIGGAVNGAVAEVLPLEKLGVAVCEPAGE